MNTTLQPKSDIDSSDKLPFYKTRKFWLIVYGLMFLFSTVIFLMSLDKNSGSFSFSIGQIIDKIMIAYGATFFMIISFKLIGSTGYFVGILIYFLFMLFLLKKTIQRHKVKLIYPLLFTTLYLQGIITSIQFMSGM